ncbi:MAG TPA: ROK family protein [Terriglobales bacterium]|nr:ROK family protein [Terriglobales bacterium]
MADKLLLGIDIGGTKVAAGLVDHSGDIIFKTRNPMNPRGTAEEGLAAVKTAIDAALKEARGAVNSVGIISPGPLDPKTGIILNPPNLPCWRNYHLVQRLVETYRMPIVLDNDANAAGLAEAIWGAGRGYKEVFYATLGTGVGTGIILNRRIFHGRTGAAAEGGHITIDYRGGKFCNCGKPGCVEALVSGTGIARRAREKARAAGAIAQPLIELAGGNIDNITGEVVGKAFKTGDPLATEILEETADILAVWLGNIIDLLEPEVIVVGGGVSELMENWFDHVRDQVPNWSVNQRANEIPIIIARYRADAGIAGAAALTLQAASAAEVALI